MPTDDVIPASGRGQIGRAARALGYAGVLPQVLAVALVALARYDGSDLGGLLALGGYALAMLYGGLILSFLGGIWWGHAMRREAAQGPLAVIAVLPSLVALGLAIGALGDMPRLPAPGYAVALGCAIILTLLVDRRLVATGEAPAGWMRLRAPLSLGLGGLTILAGVLVAY